MVVGGRGVQERVAVRVLRGGEGGVGAQEGEERGGVVGGEEEGVGLGHWWLRGGWPMGWWWGGGGVGRFTGARSRRSRFGFAVAELLVGRRRLGLSWGVLAYHLEQDQTPQPKCNHNLVLA